MSLIQTGGGTSPPVRVSRQTLQRLPLYLHYLRSLPPDVPDNISATTIAQALELGEVQVRKDLAVVNCNGKPRIGYIVQDLIQALMCFLGYEDGLDAILVGAGKLGRALLGYEGFHAYGLRIVAAFDNNRQVVGTYEGGVQILPLDALEETCRRLQARIGIVTVPANAAQQVCDRLIDSGIPAIWNFAPVHLQTPPGILVQSENMASSLAVLSNHLAERSGKTAKA